MVDIFRKPDAIAEIVDEAIARGDIDCVWFQLGLPNNEAAKSSRCWNESSYKINVLNRT